MRFFDKTSETVMRWYDGLSDRERRLLGIFFTCLCILLIVATIFLAVSKINTKSNALKIHRNELSEVKELEGEYLLAKEKTEKAKMSVRLNDVSLFTFIQGVTNRLGIPVKDLNEQKRPLPKSDIVEVSVKFSLSKLSIDKVTALIEAIETSEEGELIKVTKLKINKRFDEPDLLDLQMTVSTWKSA